jgi:YfiR/HmsC-like
MRLVHSPAAKAVLLMIVALLCLSPESNAQSQELTEYQVKAAFIYNFAKFVEWPGDAFTDSAAPLHICVLGENPFGQELMRVANGKKIGGHDLLVSNLSAAHHARDCHVLFVSSSERGRIAQVLQATGGASVLTVGEPADFLRHGGIIRFVVDEGKVRFEVNLTASEKARVKISSKLLTLARAVYSYSDGKN